MHAISLTLPYRMTVHEIFNGLMNKGYLIERILFEDLKRRVLDRTGAKDVELYECALVLGKLSPFILKFLYGEIALSAISNELFVFDISNWKYCPKI